MFEKLQQMEQNYSILQEKLNQPETYDDPDLAASLNKEQKEALRRFSETLGENNYEKRKSFFKKK